MGEITDASLLASLCNIKEEKANDILLVAGGWRALLSEDFNFEFAGIKGKLRTKIEAIREIEKRRMEEKLREGSIVKDPEGVCKYLSSTLRDRSVEIFQVLFLNKANKILATKEMFRGTVDESGVYPREIAKEALKMNATSIICSHNHPSGRTEPSQEDISITSKIREAVKALSIKLLDHIIIAGDSYFSFQEHSMI